MSASQCPTAYSWPPASGCPKTPLPRPLEPLGAVIVELVLSADRPGAMVAARPSDVRPDDQATRITCGLLNLTRKALECYRYRGVEFNSVRGETLRERGLQRGDRSIRTLTRTILTSTITHFSVHAQLDAFEGERRVFSETWNEDIARDLV